MNITQRARSASALRGSLSSPFTLVGRFMGEVLINQLAITADGKAMVHAVHFAAGRTKAVRGYGKRSQRVRAGHDARSFGRR